MTARELLERNPQPTRRRSATRCRATSAAARATSTSSTRSSRGVARGSRRMAADNAPVDRQATSSAARIPALLTRQRHVHQRLRRCPGMLHAAVLRSPHAARADPLASTASRGARAARASFAVLSGAELAEIIDPLPRFCAEEVVAARGGGRQGPLRRRGGGDRGRRVALHGRGRARAGRGRLRAARAARGPGRRGAEPGAPLRAREPRDQRRLREDVHARRRRGRLRRAPPTWSGARCAGRASCASPMEPAGAVCRLRPGSTGRMDVHSNSNMLNFAAWVLSGTLKIAPRADRLPPDVHGRELRLQAPARPR